MSLFSAGQMNQLGDKLAAAGWSAEDITNLGQAPIERLTEIRNSLRVSEIVAAIVGGKTELWLHPKQESGWVGGRKILAHLTQSGLLAGCVDLDDLRAIQAQGVDFFRKNFRGKAIFGWRGVSVGFVPCLFEFGGKVILDWSHLGCSWHACDPALRRK